VGLHARRPHPERERAREHATDEQNGRHAGALPRVRLTV
jgi:Cu/Zn superoxide dismutase